MIYNFEYEKQKRLGLMVEWYDEWMTIASVAQICEVNYLTLYRRYRRVGTVMFIENGGL